ncbi:MAG: hypothetical protein ACYCYO_00265 [Bacilli bacterium]
MNLIRLGLSSLGLHPLSIEVDNLRHIIILGTVATGKTTLLLDLVRQMQKIESWDVDVIFCLHLSAAQTNPETAQRKLENYVKEVESAIQSGTRSVAAKLLVIDDTDLFLTLIDQSVHDALSYLLERGRDAGMHLLMAGQMGDVTFYTKWVQSANDAVIITGVTPSARGDIASLFPDVIAQRVLDVLPQLTRGMHLIVDSAFSPFYVQPPWLQVVDA